MPLGFGGYRLARSRTEHRDALRQYLSAGGNLIDTSANYGLGDSELLCGELLREVARDSVIVVTKAGYIQGQNKATAVAQGYPEVVKFAPDVWHCVHPAFLRDQLDLSCARLNVEQVDVFLLHNPEYFLKDAQQRGQTLETVREEFYRRIKKAFESLEELVIRGRIAWYGVSSNTFGSPADLASHVSLKRCCEVARSVSEEHHFRVVQLPLNLLESDAAVLPVEAGETVLDYARDAGLGVLTNRPLNALVGGRLIRLADERPSAAAPASASSALESLTQTEKTFVSQFDFPLMGGGMGAAGWLTPLCDQVPTLEELRTAITQGFTPAANTWLLNADQTLKTNPRYAAWRAEFAARLDAVMLALEHKTSQALSERARALREAITRSGVDVSAHTLSQLALGAILNLPGVSCVLNGMRTPAYVQDSFGALDVIMPAARSVLERFRAEGDMNLP